MSHTRVVHVNGITLHNLCLVECNHLLGGAFQRFKAVKWNCKLSPQKVATDANGTQYIVTYKRQLHGDVCQSPYFMVLADLLLKDVLIIHQIFLILFVLCLCFPGIFLVQEMLHYSILTTTRKLLIVLGLWYVVVGVFIFADSDVLAIMEDIKGSS